jgi:hypothetical protein
MGGGIKLLRNRVSMHITEAKNHNHQSFLKLIRSRQRRINDIKTRIPTKRLTWTGRKILRKIRERMPVDIRRPANIKTLDICIRSTFINLIKSA